MELHRIAVISDTHGLLRPEVLGVLKSCETVLHAGDMGNGEILGRLKAICPVRAVRGNVDNEWAGQLPGELEAGLFGFRVYMVHNRKQIRKDLSGIDIVVYGHSHRYEERREGTTLYLNPGSCGPKRFRLPVTMAVLTLYPQERRVEAERITCVPAAGSGQCGAGPGLEAGKPGCTEEGEGRRTPEPEAGKPGCTEEGQHGATLQAEKDVDMYKLAKAIMKDVQAGKTVAGIAARYHVEEELAEEICRYYVTHPGVDVDGILDRMERRNL